MEYILRTHIGPAHAKPPQRQGYIAKKIKKIPHFWRQAQGPAAQFGQQARALRGFACAFLGGHGKGQAQQSFQAVGQLRAHHELSGVGCLEQLHKKDQQAAVPRAQGFAGHLQLGHARVCGLPQGVLGVRRPRGLHVPAAAHADAKQRPLQGGGYLRTCFHLYSICVGLHLRKGPVPARRASCHLQHPRVVMSLKSRLNLAAEPVFLMDGTAFIYRGFFANRNMQRSDGFPTNALVVVTRVLLRILREERPRHFLFVQDGKGKNFRHDIYPLYKANREATPEDLVRQLEPIARMVRALGIPREVSEGCEADDCIASLAARLSGKRPVVIVSGDKDLKQCLGPDVYMWDPAFREEKLLSAATFTAETGFSPYQLADVQALVGDTSDNIPGVPGIGPKTAQKIFEICPSLEDIRDHFALLPPKLQDKLRDHLENMFLWRELTALSHAACPHVRLEDMRVRPLDAAACASLAEEFELHALRRDMAALERLQWRDAGAPDTDAAGASSPSAAPAAAAVSSGEPPSAATAPSVPPQGAGPQMSLLEVLEEPDLPLAAKVTDLPPCTGLDVACIWPGGPDKPPHVAVWHTDAAGRTAPDGEACSCTEVRWGGTAAALCAWLKDARRLVLADLKGLLVGEACWQGLAQDRQPPFCFDLGLAAYLINPEESDYAWPRLAAYWGAPLRRSGMGPAALALRMAVVLEERLTADGLLPLYRRLELPLAPVLASMEGYGVAIDAAAFQSFLADVQAELDRLTATVYAAAGVTFNIRSAQQMGEVLFNTLKLPAPRKTRGGQASTSQETLEKLAGHHPVVESILQFRKLEKMRSTYLDPLPRLVDAQGRIHTTFNQKATATGRLSSTNPNLQNIPVRAAPGQTRACFIAGPGRSGFRRLLAGRAARAGPYVSGYSSAGGLSPGRGYPRPHCRPHL